MYVAISVGEDTFPPNCLKEIVSKRFLPGAFIPQCDKNGHYKEIQVHGSTGNSWCVHKYEGTEIEGTRVSPGQGDPKCPCISFFSGFLYLMFFLLVIFKN